MIDTDDARDYAEERAVRAEAAAEQQSEQQHLDLQSAYVRDLLAFGSDAYASAQAAIDRLTDEVTRRLPVNVHRYELLARWQHVSRLAPMVANAIEESGSYDLLAVASGVAEQYRAQHTATIRRGEALTDDRLNRALAFAVDRVIEQVARTRREDEERFAGEAEQQAAIERHEADLAARDWHPADSAVAEADGTL